MRLTDLLPIKRWRFAVAKVSRLENPLVSVSYRIGRRAFRTVANLAPSSHFGWMGTVRSLRWLDGSILEVTGWAFESGLDFPDRDPLIELHLKSRGRGAVAARWVEVCPEPLANASARDVKHDYGNTGFRAEIDVSPLLAEAGPNRRLWKIEVRVGNGKRSARGALWRRMGLGSGWLPLPRVFDGVQVLPEFIEGRGMAIGVARPVAMDNRLRLDGRRVEAELTLSEVQVAKAELVSVQGAVPLRLQHLAEGRLLVSGQLPQIDTDKPDSRTEPDELELTASPEGAKSWPILDHHLEVIDTAGRRHQVATTLDQALPHELPVSLPVVHTGIDGVARIRDTATMGFISQVESVAEPVPGVRLCGVLVGAVPAEVTLELHGARAVRPIRIETAVDGSFVAFAPWLSSAWGRPGTAPPTGRYTVRGRTSDGRWFRIVASTELALAAPTRFDSDSFACIFGTAVGRRLVFNLEALLRPDEQGEYGQQQLRKAYHRVDQPIVASFYFESFNGQQATCNPLALDQEVAERLPGVPRYWGVVNSSVQVPEGSIPVIQGTREWWSARQTSRYVISNEWLKSDFVPIPGQLVLQTWHGSMLKRIGLDRETDVIQRVALLRERAKWEFLLSQNPHSSEVFRSAYQWEKDIWEEGYPRNDALLSKPAQPIRDLLGIRDDQIAVLYAPTWREDRKEMVTFLNLKKLMAALGDRYVLLLRGHSRTMGHGADVHLRGVIDVTSYPNITDLFIAADALITDYSSVMFDYSVTGRPMIFFVPDMDDYRDSLRGVYFDLSDYAPGPVLATQDEVVEAVRTMTATEPGYAARYRAWQAKFNPYDDGQSAKRIIDRLLAQD